MSDCGATEHGCNYRARRLGCRCPEAVAWWQGQRRVWRQARQERMRSGQRQAYCRSADLDEVAVEIAMSGRKVRLTIAERHEAVRRLTAHGLSASLVAERLGINSRTVVRYRTGWHRTLSDSVC